ncbi:MAG: MBL fold metallo-hydrolase [Desulfobacteraceae bacterium]|nr:MBL fold metallo-hydrolase [Desulfobacteraceae bacterium]
MKITEGLHGFLWNSISANNCNTYLIDGPARVLIDPGHMRLFEHVNAGLQQIGMSVADIHLVITTHGHPDHIEAVKLFKDAGVLCAMSETGWKQLAERGKFYGAAFEVESCKPDFFLGEGDIDVKGLALQVLRTPGHSPGSISLYWKERKTLFTGDLIFKDGLGRTDLPGGDGNTLKHSINALSQMDVDWLLPGHGDFVSGAGQVRANFERVERYWFPYV